MMFRNILYAYEVHKSPQILYNIYQRSFFYSGDILKEFFYMIYLSSIKPIAFTVIQFVKNPIKKITFCAEACTVKP